MPTQVSQDAHLLSDDNVFKVLGAALSDRKTYEKGEHILSFLGQCRLDLIEREERYFYEEQVKVLPDMPIYNGIV